MTKYVVVSTVRRDGNHVETSSWSSKYLESRVCFAQPFRSLIPQKHLLDDIFYAMRSHATCLRWDDYQRLSSAALSVSTNPVKLLSDLHTCCSTCCLIWRLRIWLLRLTDKKWSTAGTSPVTFPGMCHWPIQIMKDYISGFQSFLAWNSILMSKRFWWPQTFKVTPGGDIIPRLKNMGLDLKKQQRWVGKLSSMTLNSANGCWDLSQSKMTQQLTLATVVPFGVH